MSHNLGIDHSPIELAQLAAGASPPLTINAKRHLAKGFLVVGRKPYDDHICVFCRSSIDSLPLIILATKRDAALRDESIGAILPQLKRGEAPLLDVDDREIHIAIIDAPCAG